MFVYLQTKLHSMLKLSIIVPVYNVEPYIRPCFESIFNQGLGENDYEIIIVNDGSTDKSMEMITDLISQHNNITVINQDNHGLSVARNNGIAAAKGEYILMPDPDDLLIENSLKPLLEKAIDFHADLVVADFLRMTNDEIINLGTIKQMDFSIQEKTGEEMFLEDLNQHECFVWRTLYKRSFLSDKNIRFYPGIRFQDVPFTNECYLKANKCLKISWLLNIYRRWSGASTGSFNLIKAKDFCRATALTWSLTHLTLNQDVRCKLENNVYISFCAIVRQTCDSISSHSERITVIDFMKKTAPDMHFHNGLKQYIITILFIYMPHTFIRLRYFYGNKIEGKLMPFYYHQLRRLFIYR